NISYPAPEPRTFSFNSPMGACPKCDGLGVNPAVAGAAEEGEIDPDEPVHSHADITPENFPCPECHGTRLRKESLFFKVANRDIAAVSALALSDLQKFFEEVKITDREKLIADRILKEIRERIGFLLQVGVD